MKKVKIAPIVQRTSKVPTSTPRTTQAQQTQEVNGVPTFTPEQKPSHSLKMPTTP